MPYIKSSVKGSFIFFLIGSSTGQLLGTGSQKKKKKRQKPFHAA